MPHVVCGLCIHPVFRRKVNKNKKAVAPALKFDEVFSSSRWKSALFKLECFPGFKTRKLKTCMGIVAQAACDDAAGLPVDLSKIFAALEVVNDQSQTVHNMDNPLSL